MLDFWQAHKDWVQYDNGSFEPVDKTGDINKKPRHENEADWWVTRKEPAWKPPKFANTKRGQQAEKDMRLTTTLEKKPETGSQFAFLGTDEEQSTPALSGPKKPATPHAKTALLTQPQHQNTGHASVRLSGPEDGKITMMQGGMSLDKTPQRNSARDTRGLKAAEKKRDNADPNIDHRTEREKYKEKNHALNGKILAQKTKIEPMRRYEKTLGTFIGADSPVIKSTSGERLEKEYSGSKSGWAKYLHRIMGFLEPSPPNNTDRVTLKSLSTRMRTEIQAPGKYMKFVKLRSIFTTAKRNMIGCLSKITMSVTISIFKTP